jgi:hypothetical protein
MPASDELRQARALFAMAGRAFPLTAYPVAPEALATALQGLAESVAPSDQVLAGQARELARELRPERDGYVLGVGLDLQYAHRLRSDEVLLEPGPARDGLDFYRSYQSVPPLAVLDLSLGRPRGLSVEAAGELRREWREGWFADSNLMDLGVDRNPLAFENNNISRGILRWHGEAGTVSIGRDKVHYGPATGGTLYPSQRLPYWDSVRADLSLGPLRLNWYVATIQARRSRSGSSLDVVPGPGFGFETDLGSTVTLQDDTELVFPATPSVILSTMHRFSWDFGSLQVGIAGLQILSRPNNYFHLTDVFPVISWHNTDVRQNNMMILADLAWTPLPGLALSAVVGLDDVNAEAVGVADRSGIPTIYAWVLGAEYYPRALQGGSSLGMEVGYTHYLWGNYDGSVTMGLDPNPLSKAIFRYLRDGGSVLMPLTSPYGPGAAWLTLGLQHQLADTPLAFNLDAILLSKNTEANLVSTPYEEDSTVAGAERAIFGSLALGASYQRGSAGLRIAPNLLYQDGTWWAELDLIVQWKLGRKVLIDERP